MTSDDVVERLGGMLSNYSGARDKERDEKAAKIMLGAIGYDALVAERDRLKRDLDALDWRHDEKLLAEALSDTGYSLGQLQAKWRDDPDAFDPTLMEWAVCDALITQGCIAATPGDGVSCAAQMIECQHNARKKAEAKLAVAQARLEECERERAALRKTVRQGEEATRGIIAMTPTGEIAHRQAVRLVHALHLALVATAPRQASEADAARSSASPSESPEPPAGPGPADPER